MGVGGDLLLNGAGLGRVQVRVGVQVGSGRPVVLQSYTGSVTDLPGSTHTGRSGQKQYQIRSDQIGHIKWEQNNFANNLESQRVIVKCIIMKVCTTCMTSPVSGGHPVDDYLNK